MNTQAILAQIATMSDTELRHAADQVYTLRQLEGNETPDGKTLMMLEVWMIGEFVKRGLLPEAFAKLMKVD